MAVPQLAGVMALLAAARPDLPMSRTGERVVTNTRPFPAGTYCDEIPDRLPAGFCGSGLLDAKAALDAALVASPPSAGGGGCTAASGGQADASLLLLALLSLGLAPLRRRNR
jgi:MYXO-CTERM domain-containing protein